MYYTPSTLTATNALAPVLDIERVVKALVPSNYTVGFMITSFPDYLNNVTSILSTTPKGALQAYFMWNVIQTFRRWINPADMKPLTAFLRNLYGQVSGFTRVTRLLGIMPNN